ncbi:MAG: DUF128 domain-containing protein [Methanomicrobiales archaeon]
MTFVHSERKVFEILRILKEQQEPIGAKRLSELMADRGFVLSDRAVQYYLSYLDEIGFTRKVGNRGRILTEKGRTETESALVETRIGYIISRLERLAFRTTFDPQTGTGDVAYNLSLVPTDQADEVAAIFEQVARAGFGFFSAYSTITLDPRIHPGTTGFITVCSITMDGVLQRRGIPVRMVYGGRLGVTGGHPGEFQDLIGYHGTTADPLELLIDAGLTSVNDAVSGKSGVVLANVREVPYPARDRVEETAARMRDAGFRFPVTMGTGVMNLPGDPHRLSVVSYSGMNLIAAAAEKGFVLENEIGAGTIPFDRFRSVSTP